MTTGAVALVGVALAGDGAGMTHGFGTVGAGVALAGDGAGTIGAGVASVGAGTILGVGIDLDLATLGSMEEAFLGLTTEEASMVEVVSTIEELPLTVPAEDIPQGPYQVQLYVGDGLIWRIAQEEARQPEAGLEFQEPLPVEVQLLREAVEPIEATLQRAEA